VRNQTPLGPGRHANTGPANETAALLITAGLTDGPQPRYPNFGIRRACRGQMIQPGVWSSRRPSPLGEEGKSFVQRDRV
jgi:hypothetical protein